MGNDATVGFDSGQVVALWVKGFGCLDVRKAYVRWLCTSHTCTATACSQRHIRDYSTGIDGLCRGWRAEVYALVTRFSRTQCSSGEHVQERLVPAKVSS